MIAKQGTDADGVPYFDDLYLDLVVYPNGKIKVDDMDELEEALRQKDITQEQFNLAVNTAATSSSLAMKTKSHNTDAVPAGDISVIIARNMREMLNRLIIFHNLNIIRGKESKESLAGGC